MARHCAENWIGTLGIAIAQSRAAPFDCSPSGERAQLSDLNPDPSLQDFRIKCHRTCRRLTVKSFCFRGIEAPQFPEAVPLLLTQPTDQDWIAEVAHPWVR